MNLQDVLFYDLEIIKSEDQEAITRQPDICSCSLDWDILNLQPSI